MKFFRNLFLAIFLITGLFSVSGRVFAAGEMTITGFDLSPKTDVTNTGGTKFQMTFRATMDVAKFNSRCGSDVNSFYWYVYEDVIGIDKKRASGEVSIDRTSTILNLNFDQNINIDTTDPDLIRGGTVKYYGQVNCSSVVSTQIARSNPSVTITFGSVTNKSYACVASNNKYACSPANLTNCSDAPACAGKPCVQIGTSLCGKDAGTSGGGGGAGGGGTGTGGGGTGGGTSGGDRTGKTKTYGFDLTEDNPLKGGASDFTSLVKIIAQWIFNLAIPIAVAMIVYSGILFLTAAGETAKVTKAREVLKYAVIGLAIILIGSGFVTLIQSILELGGPSGAEQNQNLDSIGPQLPTTGNLGSLCNKDNNCVEGLKCKNTICQRADGNFVGEACVGGVNCVQGLACDLTTEAQQVIDGQALGSCFQPNGSVGQ